MPCEWCHLGHVIVLRLNNQPGGDPGVDLFRGRHAFSVVLGGVLASQAESVPEWESLGRDEEQFPKLMGIGFNGKLSALNHFWKKEAALLWLIYK